ncbi:von Willebrand factor type A domain protein [Candidatus Magnetoovum chiemensis]|nr:von Willebrand factor type A domain protein [Candidatus Magnetoovum chiemensis]
MKFGNLDALYLFVIIIATVALYFYAFKQKRRKLALFADSKTLLNALMPSFKAYAEKVKAGLLICALCLCVVSLMRPQWGFKWEEVKRQGLDILIAIDTSKSMLASDVKPNRLEKSKLAVKDLVEKLKGDRIGLIGFASAAFLLCPLTADYSGFMLTLNDLNVNTIPRGGTSISKAIEEAVNTYSAVSGKHKTLIIITDGEDHEGDAAAAAKKAKETGIKIYTIGIGTIEGELIQVKDEKGSSEFLKDEAGNVVKSSLDEETLKNLALITEGAYIKAGSTSFGLDKIYDDYLSNIEKTETEEKMQKHYIERFQIPLGLAIILLLIELLISEERKLRKTDYET